MSAAASSDGALWLGSPLELHCGQSLPNRMVKPALSEAMADPGTNLPNEQLHRLYARWSKGGVGTILTGNVMIDRRYLETPGNVALEERDATPSRRVLYEQWAAAIHSNGSKAIMQLSHCGRQCPQSVSNEPLAPSAIRLALPGIPAVLSPVSTPRTMTLADIEEVKQRFVASARIACDSGFDGVQIHSAHGYLLSSFLSARFNHRTDAYGGSAENRRRLLLEVLALVRAAIGPQKILCVKLNSADFQKGGFTEAESLAVISELHNADNGFNIDFVEISGGTYENMTAMKSKQARERDFDTDQEHAEGKTGEESRRVTPTDAPPADAAASAEVKKPHQRESTRLREAYFVSFASLVRSSCPAAVLMLSGGWRSGIAMSRCVNDGRVDLVGLGRPLCVVPDFPRALLSSPQLQPGQLPLAKEDAVTLPTYCLDLGTPFESVNKTSEAALENFFHQRQLARMGDGLEPEVIVAGKSAMSLATLTYFLTIKFARAYIYEPRRKPRQAKLIAVGALSTLVAAAAWAFLGTAKLQQLSQQAVQQGRQIFNAASSSRP